MTTNNPPAAKTQAGRPRPLVFLDTETTGTDPVQDRIVTFAAVLNDGEKDMWIEEMINPMRPIPKEASDIHGITDEMVKTKPHFALVAHRIHSFLNGCDLCGYNIVNFDLPLLWEEFYRCGIKFDLSGVNVIDPCVIFREMEPRDLTAAMKFYCGESHEGAHGAKADVEATRKVLRSQGVRYASSKALPIDRTDLSGFCRQDRVDLAGTIALNKEGVPCYTAKRVRGVPVTQDPGFGAWMLRNEFSQETKSHLRRILGPV